MTVPEVVPVELAAGSLRLRPWRDDDIDDLWTALQDPDIRMWNSGGVVTREDAAALLARRTAWTGDHGSWAVVDADGGAFLGSVSVHTISQSRDAQVGYWVVPHARGRGIAALAVDAACRWAFGELGMDRIELAHAVENTASGRVAEKAGFTYEGRLRRSFTYGDGVKHDELLWSRLSDDPPPEHGLG